MEVLYILGNGTADRYNELKFSLRCLEKHTEHDKVVVLGENPRFNSSELIYEYCREYNGNKEWRIYRKIFEACKRGLVKGDFLFMNDDHFFIKDVDLENYPYYAKGQLKRSNPNRFYQQSLVNTKEYLEKHGKTTYHFDIHTPIIYNAKKFLELEPHFNESKKLSCGFVVKSIYGNWYDLTPTIIKDIKINRFNNEKYHEQIKDAHVFSCSDSGWRLGVKEWLNKNYPNKSKYEK